MTAIACGMAMTGARAYTYSIGNFPTLRCLEQLRNDVCYHHADVTVVAVGGGFSYGQLGVSHFATEDLAIMRALPGMTVVAPSDPWQAYELTRQLHARRRPGLPAHRQGVGGPAAGRGPARQGERGSNRRRRCDFRHRRHSRRGGCGFRPAARRRHKRAGRRRTYDQAARRRFDRRIGARLRSRADARGTCHRGRAWRRNRGNLP